MMRREAVSSTSCRCSASIGEHLFKALRLSNAGAAKFENADSVARRRRKLRGHLERVGDSVRLRRKERIRRLTAREGSNVFLALCLAGHRHPLGLMYRA